MAKKLRLWSNLLEYLHPNTMRVFNEICSQQSMALRLFCERLYFCRYLKGDTTCSIKNSKRYSSYKDLPYRYKVKIVENQDTILNNYEQEIKFVLSSEPRNRYYKAFLDSIGIKEDGDRYCYEHLEELDKYILSVIKPIFDSIQSEYPNGTSLFKTNNHNRSYGSKFAQETDRYFDYITNKEEIISLEEKYKVYLNLLSKYPLSITKYKRKYILDKSQIEKIISFSDSYWTESEAKELEAKRMAKIEMIEAVKEWDQADSVKIFSLYNYYPTTSSVPSTSDVWATRNLIWAFKDTRPVYDHYRRIITHEKAVSDVIGTIKAFLNYTFGINCRYLTLFCIPASTRENTLKRYEDFSFDLCQMLEMEESLQHVDFESETTPKHEGGVGHASIKIDEKFFKNKLVLLFDDVITSGSSMSRYASMLENAGASVIAGVSIGRTRHQKSEHPIDVLKKEKGSMFLSLYSGSTLYTGDIKADRERPFNVEEIAVIKDAKTVISYDPLEGHDRLYVRITFKNAGGACFFPLTKDSTVGPGQTLDPKKFIQLMYDKGPYSSMIRYID